MKENPFSAIMQKLFISFNQNFAMSKLIATLLSNERVIAYRILRCVTVIIPN
jgi:hypothetical protein